MTQGRDISKIVEAARYHYKTVSSDITNAKDRVEHIRLTALAQQAHNLLMDLIEFETGLVYSHTAERANEQLIERIPIETPLDIPEFKSPYNPDA
jgi:hypothetical protein